MFQFHSFQVGSAVYYVLFDGPRYRIRKTRIAEITKRPSSRLYFDKYHYRCEDGYSFESVEALVPNFVFLTRKEAISFVIELYRIINIVVNEDDTLGGTLYQITNEFVCVKDLAVKKNSFHRRQGKSARSTWVVPPSAAWALPSPLRPPRNTSSPGVRLASLYESPKANTVKTERRSRFENTGDCEKSR